MFCNSRRVVEKRIKLLSINKWRMGKVSDWIFINFSFIVPLCVNRDIFILWHFYSFVKLVIFYSKPCHFAMPWFPFYYFSKSIPFNSLSDLFSLENLFSDSLHFNRIEMENIRKVFSAKKILGESFLEPLKGRRIQSDEFRTQSLITSNIFMAIWRTSRWTQSSSMEKII